MASRPGFLDNVVDNLRISDTFIPAQFSLKNLGVRAGDVNNDGVIDDADVELFTQYSSAMEGVYQEMAQRLLNMNTHVVNGDVALAPGDLFDVSGMSVYYQQSDGAAVELVPSAQAMAEYQVEFYFSSSANAKSLVEAEAVLVPGDQIPAELTDGTSGYLYVGYIYKGLTAFVKVGELTVSSGTNSTAAPDNSLPQPDGVVPAPDPVMPDDSGDVPSGEENSAPEVTEPAGPDELPNSPEETPSDPAEDSAPEETPAEETSTEETPTEETPEPEEETSGESGSVNQSIEVTYEVVTVRPVERREEPRGGAELPDQSDEGESGSDMPDQPGEGEGGTETPDQPGKGEGNTETPDQPDEGEGGTGTPDQPSEGEGGAETPDQPDEGEGGTETPDQPGEGEGGTETPDQPGEGEDGAETPDQPGEGEGDTETPDQPGKGESKPETPDKPAEDVEQPIDPVDELTNQLVDQILENMAQNDMGLEDLGSEEDVQIMLMTLMSNASVFPNTLPAMLDYDQNGKLNVVDLDYIMGYKTQSTLVQFWMDNNTSPRRTLPEPWN